MISHLSGVFAVSPGWLALACAGVAVLAYFLGCFNGAVVVSKYVLRNDVRDHGSGNAGLTNFHRTFGGPLTGAVVAADVAKAVIAVLFSMWIFGVLSPDLITFSKYWAGMFCLLGHMFPCTFQFRGGKGILSGGAIAIMIDWRVALVVWGGFLVLAVLTRYVSLGSCWAGASFPFVTGFVYRDVVLVVMAVIIGGLILWKHRGNIQRLVSGTESKFTLHKKTEETKPEEETKPKEETES
jgi:glycerol-3-phosphate acyltransferase PlsY